MALPSSASAAVRSSDAMGGVADAEREAEGDGEMDLDEEVEGGARGSYLPHSISMDPAKPIGRT